MAWWLSSELEWWPTYRFTTKTIKKFSKMNKWTYFINDINWLLLLQTLEQMGGATWSPPSLLHHCVKQPLTLRPSNTYYIWSDICSKVHRIPFRSEGEIVVRWPVQLAITQQWLLCFRPVATRADFRRRRVCTRDKGTYFNIYLIGGSSCQVSFVGRPAWWVAWNGVVKSGKTSHVVLDH